MSECDLQWSYECEEKFQKLKTLLTSTLILTLPKECVDFTIYCCAFGVGLGGVLMYKGKLSYRHYLYGLYCEVFRYHHSHQYILSERDIKFRQRKWFGMPEDYDIWPML